MCHQPFPDGDALEVLHLARTVGRAMVVLEEAFVFEKRIDSVNYDRQRDKLREDVALARIELTDAELETIDVEGLLGLAEYVLTDAARLWLEPLCNVLGIQAVG